MMWLPQNLGYLELLNFSFTLIHDKSVFKNICIKHQVQTVLENKKPINDLLILFIA